MWQKVLMSALIPKHGGYRKLKSFQVAQLVCDVTVRFCHKYVDKRSRTHDQMVQAQWRRENLLRQALIDRRYQTADEVAAWVMEAAKRSRLCGQNGRGGQVPEIPTGSTASTLPTNTYAELSANAALTLLAVACSLLDRQVVERLAIYFETEGGFTERLYRVRSAKRKRSGQS